MKLKAIFKIEGVNKVLTGAGKGTTTAHPGDMFISDEHEKLIRLGVAVSPKKQGEDAEENDDFDDLGLGEDSTGQDAADKSAKKPGRKASK